MSNISIKDFHVGNRHGPLNTKEIRKRSLNSLSLMSDVNM